MDGPATTNAKRIAEGEGAGAECEYLCVDSYLTNIADASALSSALEMGLIDYLVRNGPTTTHRISRGVGGDERGVRLLCSLLIGNRVIEECDGEIRVTQGFAKALRFRDLLETKLEFAQLAMPDVMGLFTMAIQEPGHFSRRSRIFNLFNYSRCFDGTPENYHLTKRWMRITSSLTKYESGVCMRYHDFSRYCRMLDIGGNSGEFALQICRRHPAMHAAVFDLPLVCDIGQEHVRSEPEAERIRFLQGNVLTDPLPSGFDLITFKSMLHDWPEEEAKRLIRKASRSVKAGGTLLIFERGPLDVGAATVPYSMIPFLLFFRSFRSAVVYEKHLKDLGFQQIVVDNIELEMPWFCVQGSKTV